MQMIRWKSGIFKTDRMASEELRKLVDDEPIITVIRSSMDM